MRQNIDIYCSLFYVNLLQKVCQKFSQKSKKFFLVDNFSFLGKMFKNPIKNNILCYYLFDIIR